MALTNCPDCSKEVSDQAAQCIHCGAPIKKKSRSVLGPIVWIVFLIIAGLWIIGANSGNSAEKSARWSACRYAEDQVKRRLKSPSSSVFPGCVLYDVRATPGNKIIYVSGHVDSQNAFGAMLRSEFVVKINTHDDASTDRNWTSEVVVE